MDAVLNSMPEPERIRGDMLEVVAELVTNADATLLVIEHKGRLVIKKVERGGRCFAVLAFIGEFATA